jgi:hypothetical protein
MEGNSYKQQEAFFSILKGFPSPESFLIGGHGLGNPAGISYMSLWKMGSVFHPRIKSSVLWGCKFDDSYTQGPRG